MIRNHVNFYDTKQLSKLTYGSVLLIFLLPYISLRFSYISALGVLNAFFLIFIILVAVIPVIRQSYFSYRVVLPTIVFLLVSLYGIFIGLKFGLSFQLVTKKAFESMGPVMLFLLLLISKTTISKFNIGLVRPLLLFELLNALYSSYQYFFISNYQDMWFYRPLLTVMDYETPEWDIVRNDVIRASGFFVSSLENGYVISIACFYFIIKTVKRFTYSNIFLLLFFLWIGYITGARTFYVGLTVGLLSWGIIESKWRRYPIISAFIVPLLSVIVTYLFIVLFIDYVDLSMVGRLSQLGQVLNIMSLNPLGYGFGAVGPGSEYIFDSTYATWFISVGGLGGAGIIYIYYWSSRELLLSLRATKKNENEILTITVFALGIDLVYSSAFQYTTNTGVRWFYALAAALLINNHRALKRKHEQTR